MTSDEKVVWDAEFNDAVTTYWLLNGAMVCVFTIFGILFLPVWFFVGKWATRKYLDSHKCTLTNRSLKVNKGILTQIEKTVPLDRITDVGVIQGPIMRYFDIEALKVETAGQSSSSALVQLAGIKDGRKFRDAVLRQRELVVGSNEQREGSDVSGVPVGQAANQQIDLLQEIRDTLVRIEKQGGQQ